MMLDNPVFSGRDAARRKGALLATASICCLMAFAPCSVAQAQGEDGESVETVVVTGFRRSLETTEAIKRESVGLIEAVSSMDIGKLPDISIAESLSRLPGLAGQRVAGRAQVVAIRGLSPDFAGTTLNGREQVSTGDNRGVEFDQYPAEILSGAVVYKTPDAKLQGQGLSGTVDLRTVRPLDYDNRRVAMGVRGEYNELGQLNPKVSPWGNRINFVYIDQYLDGKLGLAVGFAHLDSPNQSQTYQAWWWANADEWGQAQTGKPSDAITLQGAQAYQYARDQVRDSVVATLEYKPNDIFHSVLDLYYSNYGQTEHMNGVQWTDDPWTSYDGGTTYISYEDVETKTLGSTNLVTRGAWNGIRPLVRNDLNTRTDVLMAAGWRNELTLDRFSLALDLSYSGAKRNESVTETYAGTVTPESYFAFDIPSKPSRFPTFTPGVDYSDTSVVGIFDAQSYGREGRNETPHQRDTIQAVRLEGKYEFGGIISSVEMGIGFKTRQKKKTSQVYYLESNAADADGWQAIPTNLLYDPVSLDYVGIGDVVAYDVEKLIATSMTKTVVMSTDDYRKDFTVKEKIGTLYLMFNVESNLFDIATVKGNIGAQLVHTDQYSSAYNIDSHSSVPVGDLGLGKSYNDFLPSINFTFDFDDGNMVRIGIAKTLARPRIDDMRASASAGVSDTAPYQWSGSGGNPRLSPWRADSIDIAYEHYFGKASYVAVAGFYKNMRSYIYSQTISDYDFSDYINTTTHTPVSDYGNYTTPANGKGGYMRGMEISAALDGALFDDWLDGFGTVLSFSWTDSSIKSDGPNSSEVNTLPGLSKAVASAVFYYEKDGWSFRISERYRSDFRGEITTLFAQRSYTRILGEATTDVQVGYEFQDGTFAGLSIVAQVENLADTPYRTVQTSSTGNIADAPLDYQVYGRQFLLGLSYKL